ncbi:MAG: hypothetical protein J6Y92_01260 [Lentisphaeria bacterium]|nr:hypothetical protein [Lentisphaeria bacterium]
MKHYFFEGRTYDELPDPLKTATGTISPVSEALFVSLGGEIADDGAPTQKERVCAAFSGLIDELAKKTDAVTPEEFLSAAGNGISSDLIAFARSRGVPEEVIAEGRARIVEIMADALRFGMTWAELVNGATGV